MNKIIINGQEFNVPSGSKVKISNGQVYIDSNSIFIIESDLKIEIVGKIENFQCDKNVEIKNSTITNINAGGNVCCQQVGGNIESVGNITCGNVEGNVHGGGNVICGKVGGNTSSGGNLICKK